MSNRKKYKKVPQKDVACCPIIKCHMDDLAGLEIEAQERIANDTKNIDKSRSKFNLFIKGFDDDKNLIIDNNKYEKSLQERVMERIKKTGAHIRVDDVIRMRKKSTFHQKGKNKKASVVAVGIELQLSHELAMKYLEDDGLLDETGRICKPLTRHCKTYQILMESYKYVCDTYGADNVVGGYVHLDEYTPHLHVFVVPIAMKKRKYRGRDVKDAEGNPIVTGVLDAKHIFGKDALRQQWKGYSERLRPFGATTAKGLAPKGTYTKVASITGMLESAQEELNARNEDLAELELIIEQQQERKTKLENYCQEVKETIKILNDNEESMRQMYARNLYNLSNLHTFSGMDEKTILPFLDVVNNTLKEYIEGYICTHFVKGKLITMDIVDDSNYGVLDNFGIQTEGGLVQIKVAEKNGAIWKDGRLLMKDGSELHNTYFANYLSSLPKNTKMAISYKLRSKNHIEKQQAKKPKPFQKSM